MHDALRTALSVALRMTTLEPLSEPTYGLMIHVAADFYDVASFKRGAFAYAKAEGRRD
jgi:hypothetical protein